MIATFDSCVDSCIGRAQGINESLIIRREDDRVVVRHAKQVLKGERLGGVSEGNIVIQSKLLGLIM